MRLRRRPPLGHRNHGARAIPYTSHHFAWCECGYSERGLSEGAASGALAAHLRHAKPGVGGAVDYVPDDVEERLVHAADTMQRGGDLDVVREDIDMALAHYRHRLTQPEPQVR